jgi:hypothetical protein
MVCGEEYFVDTWSEEFIIVWHGVKSIKLFGME